MPGLERQVLQKANVDLLFKRIRKDTRTDLITAPHYDIIYERGAAQLWGSVSRDLASGTYDPDLPVKLDVPKPRGFNRPGGILHPYDRVVYQLLADEIAETIEANLDRRRVFSNVLVSPDLDGDMFQPHSETYENFQDTILRFCDSHSWFTLIDIANYYEQLPHHPVINMLQSTGANSSAINLLEFILSAFRQKTSTGLIQGLFPSDLLGNFYLSSFDYQCEMENLSSARFVDDIYIPVSSYSIARARLTWAIDRLRRDNLYINEAKSGLREASVIHHEQTEVNETFLQAANAANESGVMDYIDDSYGFRVEVADPTPISDVSEVNSEIALEAIQRLLVSEDRTRFDMTAKIDKFVFPILTTLQSDIALDRACVGILARPYLAQIYAVYLSRFVGTHSSAVNGVTTLLRDSPLGNYEKMLLLASLQHASTIDGATVSVLLSILTDTNNPEPVRALSAIVACKYGTAQQQRTVRNRYEDEPSPYMRAALLYSTQFMSPGDRNTCRRVWGAHSKVNGILASLI